MEGREYFWLDGVRCDTVGIRLQKPVTFTGAVPKLTTVTVPGRNGDLHYYDGSFENVEGIASCFLLKKHDVDTALSAVSKWALMQPGYHRLETSEEPEFYRMAAIKNGPETEIRMRLLAPFTISFDCMPQKFLKSGERTIVVKKSGTKIRNEWFPSNPLITVIGNGVGQVGINGRTIDLLSSFSGELTYDAETENAYYQSQNRNNQIKAPEKVFLPNGEFTVAWSGGVQSVKIIPKWWTL